MTNGSAVPISYPLAFDRLSAGIYWAVFTHVREHATGIVDLNAYLGERFQDYVGEALQTAAADTGSTRAILERELRVTPGHSCSDAILLEGKKLVLAEATVSGLTKRTLLAGDVAGFRSELRDKKLRRKFSQPLAGARELINGTVSHDDINMEEIDEIYPLLITLQPFPQFISTWQEIDAIYTPPTHLRSAGGHTILLHRIQLLSSEELEMLEPGIALGATLSAMLQDKENGDPHRAMSMKNHIFDSGVAREHDNTRMHDLYDEMVKTAQPSLREFFSDDAQNGAAE